LKSRENGQNLRFRQDSVTQGVNFGHHRPENVWSWPKMTLSAQVFESQYVGYILATET